MRRASSARAFVGHLETETGAADEFRPAFRAGGALDDLAGFRIAPFALHVAQRAGDPLPGLNADVHRSGRAAERAKGHGVNTCSSAAM